jgi:hypothetical protein
MFSIASLRRDPFEGSGAYHRRLRLIVEGTIALALAITACGLATAMWLRTLEPLMSRIALG